MTDSTSADGSCSPKFSLNGQKTELQPGISVAELLVQLEAAGPGVAVERNAMVVPRAQHPSTIIQAGDQIEVVRLVGGG
jgi:sulfur carrier protein